MELVLSAVLFGLIGLWIDSKVGTTPIFAVVFTLLGFAGAALSVYYRYRHDIAQLERQRDQVRAEAVAVQQINASQHVSRLHEIDVSQPRTETSA